RRRQITRRSPCRLPAELTHHQWRAAPSPRSRQCIARRLPAYCAPMDVAEDEEQQKLEELLHAVVNVITVSDAPDYEQPWQTEGPSHCSGSGAVVETAKGSRVLTNAHCVENAVFVEVRRYGQSDKFVAEVEAIGHEC